MKQLPLLLLAILFLVACEKENLSLDRNSSSLAMTFHSETIIDDCGSDNCIQLIAETKAANQALANSLCDTVWQEITCCADGLIAYALVYTAPNCGPKSTARKE